jgi:hypothetical protein
MILVCSRYNELKLSSARHPAADGIEGVKLPKRNAFPIAES